MIVATPASPPTKQPSPAVPIEAPADRWKFAVVVTGAFTAVAVFNVVAHVLWRDEFRWWQFAVTSPTFAEMRAQMRFEGAPMLWYGALWLLARVSANDMAMRLLHVLISSGTVFLFAWRAPFPRAARLLFPLGYYTLFEYTTIVRNYGLIFFLSVAAAALISSPRRRPMWFGAVLFGLTQTNIWGVGIAGVLFLSALLEWTLIGPRERRVSWWSIAALGVVVVGGAVCCYVSSLPGPGENFLARWDDDETVARKFALSVGRLWRGYVPIPLIKRTFWGSNIIDGPPVYRFVAACLVFAAAAMVYLRRPAALVPLVLGSVGLMAFTFLFFVGHVRHDGLFYVLLIAAAWIGETATRVSIPWPRLARINAWFEARGGKLLMLLFVVQAIGGVGAAAADHFLPFSAGKRIAEYIHAELPSDITLLGYADYRAATVGYYSGRRIHSIECEVDLPFFTQDDRLRVPGSPELLVERVEQLLERSPGDVLVILDPMRDEELTAWCAAHPERAPPWERIGRISDATVEDEASVLHRARQNRSDNGSVNRRGRSSD